MADGWSTRAAGALVRLPRALGDEAPERGHIGDGGEDGPRIGEAGGEGLGVRIATVLADVVHAVA